MSRLEVNRCKDKISTQQSVGKYLETLIIQKLKHQTPILFMVSGGSSLGVLDYIDLNGSDISNLTLSVVDERYDERPDHNNCAQVLLSSFWKKYGADLNLIDTRLSQGLSHGEHSVNFEQNLRDWKIKNPTGLIIGLFGVGPDGHTSGVLPGFPDLWSSQSWAIAYDIGNYNNPEKLRTTTTPLFIQEQVDFPIVFMCGSDKRVALQSLLSNTGTGVDLPCLLFHNMHKSETVPVFTDIEL